LSASSGKFRRPQLLNRGLEDVPGKPDISAGLRIAHTKQR
jgi:hypothetical protein